MAEQQKLPQVAAPLRRAQSVSQDAPESSGVIENIGKALKMNKVIHGASEAEYELAGKSAGYVREALGTVLNIHNDAKVYIDGVESSDDTIITESSVVEFIRSSGTKGISL